MDLNGLSGVTGTAYLEQYRLGGNNSTKGAADFAETLRKTAAERATEITPESDSKSGKVTIDKTDKLYEQCLELEIFMVKTLVSSMRNTIQKSGLIDEGFAGKMYEDMLYDEYAKDFTKNAGFGMAELAYLELSGQRGKVVIR